MRGSTPLLSTIFALLSQWLESYFGKVEIPGQYRNEAPVLCVRGFIRNLAYFARLDRVALGVRVSPHTPICLLAWNGRQDGLKSRCLKYSVGVRVTQ